MVYGSTSTKELVTIGGIEWLHVGSCGAPKKDEQFVFYDCVEFESGKFERGKFGRECSISLHSLTKKLSAQCLTDLKKLVPKFDVWTESKEFRQAVVSHVVQAARANFCNRRVHLAAIGKEREAWDAVVQSGGRATKTEEGESDVDGWIIDMIRATDRNPAYAPVVPSVLQLLKKSFYTYSSAAGINVQVSSRAESYGSKVCPFSLWSSSHVCLCVFVV